MQILNECKLVLMQQPQHSSWTVTSPVRSSGSILEPESLTVEQPESFTEDLPESLTVEQPESFTEDLPESLTVEQPESFTEDLPESLTVEQPESFTEDLPP